MFLENAKRCAPLIQFWRFVLQDEYQAQPSLSLLASPLKRDPPWPSNALETRPAADMAMSPARCLSISFPTRSLTLLMREVSRSAFNTLFVVPRCPPLTNNVISNSTGAGHSCRCCCVIALMMHPVTTHFRRYPRDMPPNASCSL